MVLIPVRCPQCHSDQIIKGGVTKADKQRYRCPLYTTKLCDKILRI